MNHWPRQAGLPIHEIRPSRMHASRDIPTAARSFIGIFASPRFFVAEAADD